MDHPLLMWTMFALAIVVLAAALAKTWYMHVYFKEQSTQTYATRFLDKFHQAWFILSCIGLVGMFILHLYIGNDSTESFAAPTPRFTPRTASQLYSRR